MLIEIPIVILYGARLSWAGSLLFPSSDQGRFVWWLCCASLLPALLGYMWVTALGPLGWGR